MRKKKYKYRNPWFEADKNYGSEFYETSNKPIEYKGFQIFNRFKGCHELVKNGICLTQRGGATGCKMIADGILSGSKDYFVQRAKSYLKLKGAI